MTRKRILLIEDDADMRRGLGCRLNAHGYQTTFAADGVTAVSAARRDRPDLILLDLGLPGGDGFVVLDRLRSLMPISGVPVIIVSAREPEKNYERAARAGVLRFFQKPVDVDNLMAAIDGAMAYRETD